MSNSEGAYQQYVDGADDDYCPDCGELWDDCQCGGSYEDYNGDEDSEGEGSD